ncbi:hypothetical protein M2138_001518 [Dysgonomonadaceae bacterium PH5-43]|nr:hypothetical protein [Dysgonomonadaceae bacterium PH5-43]
MKYKIYIISIFTAFSFSSCKLHSLTSDSEFTQHNSPLKDINGTYTINQDANDSIYYGRMRKMFIVSDLVKQKDKELLKDKSFEQLTILYDGKEKISFSLFDGKENLQFTYKCKPKENYLEVYFTKRRIWALPLFMNYEYDRLRLGINEESNLIFHKWHTILATLTIMPFDYFGGSDYSHTLLRVNNKEQ